MLGHVLVLGYVSVLGYAPMLGHFLVLGYVSVFRYAPMLITDESQLSLASCFFFHTRKSGSWENDHAYILKLYQR